MMRQMVLFAWASLAIGLLGLVAGCAKHSAAGASAQPTVVRVSRPVVREVTDYVYFTGRTEAPESVQTRARVTGYLVKVDFEAGAEVKQGQRLFQVDPRPYKAELDRANSQVLLAQARLKLANADNARAQEVAKTPGAISSQDLDRYASAQAEADAALQAARASAEIDAINLSFTDVTSPINGIVSRNLLTVGNLVQQDTTLLTTVVSQDPMYVYFDVDERTLLRAQQLIREGKIKAVAEGGVVAVQIGLANEGNEYPHEGAVDFINNQVDPSTGTIELRGVLKNPPLTKRGMRLFKPGMFVRVRLPMGSPFQALLVPQSALGTDQGSKYLLVVDAKNVVEYRPVNVGPEQPGGLQVVEPIKVVRTKESLRPAGPGETGEDSITPNDLVIVSGLQRARPGGTVTPRMLKPELPSMAVGRN